MAHTHTAQGRAEHVRAVSEWLGKAHARHHHKMFERRKQLAEFRYHDIRRQMLERAEWDAKVDKLEKPSTAAAKGSHAGAEAEDEFQTAATTSECTNTEFVT